MRRSAVYVLSLSAMLPVAAYADSDTGGHKHAGAADHHTMHDQMSDKPWEMYGALYMGLQSNNPGSKDSADGDEPARNTYLSSEGTTIGFRGAFPLEGSLKAVWQIESMVNLDEVNSDCSGGGHTMQPSNCNDSMLAGGHNTFIGLTGDFGTVLAGKHNTPFFDATIQFDLFHHLPGDVRGVLGSIPESESGSGDHHANTFNASAADMIMYKSPKMSGFTVEAAIFGLNESVEKSDDKSSAFGIGARYEQPMFTLVAAIERHKNYDITAADLLDSLGDPGTDGIEEDYMIATTTGVVLGGMVHLNEGHTMIGAFIEQLKATDMTHADGSVTDESRNGFYINFQQRFMGKNKVKFAYANAGEFMTDDGAAMFALSYARELGTGTEAYVTYAATKNDDMAMYSNGTVGALGAGGDPSTFGIGLVHMF